MAAALGFDAVVHMSADARNGRKTACVSAACASSSTPATARPSPPAGRRRWPRRAATSSTTSNPSCCSSATPPPRAAWRGSWPRRAARSTPDIRCSSTSPAASAARRAASPMDSRRCTATTCIASSPSRWPRRACWCSWPPACRLHVRLRPGPGQPHRGRRPGGRAGVELVASLMTPQLGGVFTVSDDELYLNLLALKDSLDAEVEPSAAAAVSGPGWLQGSAAGRAYAQGLPWPTPRTSSGPPADRWCRDAARLPGTRQDAAPPRGLSRHAAIPKILGIPQISSRFPADLRQIPGRPHTNNDIPRRQPVSASASLPAGRAATPDQQALKTRPTERSRCGSFPS